MYIANIPPGNVPPENFEIFNSRRCILLHFEATNSKFILSKNTEVYSFINYQIITWHFPVMSCNKVVVNSYIEKIRNEPNI